MSQADLKATVAKVDGAVAEVKQLLAAANSTDGTLGKLINDKSLYDDINHTVNSADSLLIDLKANPKRYVHFSLFGGNKDKDDKKKKSRLKVTGYRLPIERLKWKKKPQFFGTSVRTCCGES